VLAISGASTITAEQQFPSRLKGLGNQRCSSDDFGPALNSRFKLRGRTGVQMLVDK
jgi:hypothetical protein